MGQGKSKQGVVTTENREEAHRLRNIWDAKRAALRAARKPVLSQEAFGAEFNIGNQAAVGFFLNGKTALSFKAASGFARGLGCRIADFSPRLAQLGEAGAAPIPPSTDLAVRLGIEFAALPDPTPNGLSKPELFEQLLAMMKTPTRAASSPPADVFEETMRSATATATAREASARARKRSKAVSGAKLPTKTPHRAR